MEIQEFPVYRKTHEGTKLHKIVSEDQMVTVQKTHLTHEVKVTKNRSVIEQALDGGITEKSSFTEFEAMFGEVYWYVNKTKALA